MNTEYQLSGRSGSLWLTGLLSGPVLVLLLSIVYAYIDVYNPFVYLTLLVYVGYLVGILIILYTIFRLGKCRNRKQALLFGGLLGLITLYATWCSFLFVFMQRYGQGIGLSELVLNPDKVLGLMLTVGDDGWYEMLGLKISGGLLWLFWIVEAVGIVGAGFFGGSAMMHEEVFCEDCNEWTKDMELNLRLSPGDGVKAAESIDKNIAGLLDLPVAAANDPVQLRVNVNHCKGCDSFNTVDVDKITQKRNKKGELEEEAEDISPVFVIDKELYQRFLDKGKERPVAKDVVIEEEAPSEEEKE